MADERAGVSLLPRDGRASGPGAAPAGGILRINEVPDETEPRPPCPGCCCRGPDWLINMYTPVASTRPWSPALSWGWIVVLSGIILAPLGCLAMVQSNDRWNEMTGVNWVGMLASTMPLIAFELGLGCPPVAAYIRQATDETVWAGHLLTLVVPGAWLVNASFGGTFDGLALGFWVVTSYAMVGALKQVRHEPALTWTDCTVLLLTMPLLDYRWFEASYYYGMTWYGYDFISLCLTVQLIVYFLVFRRLPRFGFRLLPNWRDAAVALGGLVSLGIPLIVIGLATGFFVWPPTEPVRFAQVVGVWIENMLTIALTEETMFRVVLFAGLTKRFPERRWWIPMLISSVAFGLWHWPRIADVGQKIIYMIFAFCYGCMLCTVYRLSGYNIIAGMMMHSSVDTIWENLLS